MRSQLIKFLKFTVAFGLIGWMVAQGHLDIHDFDLLLDPKWAIILWLVAGLNILAVNWRWSVLLAVKKFPSSIKTTFPLTLIGMFFNYAVPGAVGGDMVKAFYLAKDHPQRKMQSFSTILLDRLIGLYAMSWLAVFSLFLDVELILSNNKLKLLGLGIILATLVQTILFAISFSGLLRAKLQFLQKIKVIHKLYEVVHSYREHREALIKTFALSLLSQLVSIFFLWLVGVALHETSIPLSTFLFAAPIGFVISSLPISPAGIGVGQVAFLILFQLHSGQQTQLGQISISILQLEMFVWGLIGAFFYVKGRKQIEAQEAVTG